MALVGCSDKMEEDKKTPVAVVPEYKDLVASVDSAMTRVYAEEDLSLAWHKDDALAVFYGNDYNNTFTFTGEDGDKSGSFTLTGEGGVGATTLDRIYALYPYQPTATISATGTISLHVPAVQNYAEGSFPRNGNIMVAASSSVEDVVLPFRNALGYLKLKLYGEGTVQSITVKGNAKEKISGSATIAPSTTDAPEIVMGESATTTITLDCGDGVALASDKGAATEFWIAMPATTFSSGITITVTDAEGAVFTKKTTNEVVVERNYIKPMAALAAVFEMVKPPSNQIWYTTTDGEQLTLVEDRFGAAITSHQKSGDRWVVTFDRNLTMLGKEGSYSGAFESLKTLASVVLPNSITKIGMFAFYRCSALEDVTLSDNLQTIGGQAFDATKLSAINIPATVTSIENKAFYSTNTLKTVNVFATTPPSLTNKDVFPLSITVYVPEGAIATYEKHAVWGNFLIKALPDDALEDNEGNQGGTGNEGGDNTEGGTGNEGGNEGGEGGSGNEGEEPGGSDPVVPPTTVSEICYTTTDGNAISVDASGFDATIASHVQRGNEWVITFSGAVTSLRPVCGRGAFDSKTTLSTITLPNSVVSIDDYTFYACSNLQSVELSNSTQYLGGYAFYGCTSLTEATLPATITEIEGAAFYGCTSLATIDLLATTPPTLGEVAFPDGVTIRVPDDSISAYLMDNTWNKYTIKTLSGNVTGDEEMYAPNDPDYVSTDFSANGTVTTLMSATEGNGIDIVIMGDGYSDRQVASGRYEADMRRAVEHIFSEEPYKSFRNLFNVYMVTLVSKLEGCSDDYVYDSTALNCNLKSDGISIGADTWESYEYTQNILGATRADEAMTIVIMNWNIHAGVCYMREPQVNTSGTYGNGDSLSYIPLSGDDESFRKLILHEAAGHGFAKLGDEYYSSGAGKITAEDYDLDFKYFETWGWYKNIDCTREGTLDATTVKWKHFLADSRYANEGLGVYLGAFTYSDGAYRPTEDSLMHHRNGGFNAPSREAIYIRIHKLAYGSSWQYNYEEFVAWDAL